VSQELDQTLSPQPLSPQISLLGQSPVLFPEVFLSSVEPDKQICGASQSPVEDCQAAPALNEDEEMSQLPQVNSIFRRIGSR